MRIAVVALAALAVVAVTYACVGARPKQAPWKGSATRSSERKNAPAAGGTCGMTPVKPNISNVTTKIVGGETALPYSWPWQVDLCTKSWMNDKICDLHCGGSVVAPGWVLGAASCVVDHPERQNYKIKAGVFNERTSDQDAEQTVGIKAIHMHPDFSPCTGDNDIALFELATPLVYGDHVQPVCLPNADSIALAYPGNIWLTGWGITSELQILKSVTLQQANIPIVDTGSCQVEYPALFFPEDQFCAGKWKVDMCEGDAGGPAVSQDRTGAWFQYGITSWSQWCAVPGKAGIYSRVSVFCDWLDETSNGAVQCRDSQQVQH